MSKEYNELLDKTLGDKRKNEFMANFDLNRSLINYIAGDFVGEGQHRTVFDSVQYDGCVVKIENGLPSGNLLEWKIWEMVKDVPKLAKWFAPCIDISDCGRILVMKKVDYLDGKEWNEAKIPTWFTDRKPSNFGKIKKQIVAIDYEMCLIRFMYFGMPDRLIKASRYH